MSILITENEVMSNGGRSIEVTNGKKTVSVYLTDSLATVCVKNASHDAYRGFGRVFSGVKVLKQAVASYRDKAVVAMIEAVSEAMVAEVS